MLRSEALLRRVVQTCLGVLEICGWHPLVLRSEALLRRVVQTCLGVLNSQNRKSSIENRQSQPPQKLFSSSEFVIRFYRKQLGGITTGSAAVMSCFYIYGGFGAGDVPR